MSGSRVVLPAKAVGDTTRYQIDFLSQLSEGETLDSATCTMSVYCGSDSSPSDMLVGNPFLLGTKVVQLVQAGERGVIYQLTVTAVTDLLQILVVKAYLVVLDPDSDMTSNVCCPRIGNATSANGKDFVLDFPSDPVPSYTDGLQLFVIFDNDVTTQSLPTLNVDSLGAKGMYWTEAQAAIGYEILTDDVLHFVYNQDLAAWNIIGRTDCQWLCIAAQDQTAIITTGTAKFTLPAMPGFSLISLRAALSTASTSGVVTFDINEDGVSMLSTKLTIDANETSSLTAATPAVISDRSFAAAASYSIDIDTAGTGAKGWAIMMRVRWT